MSGIPHPDVGNPDAEKRPALGPGQLAAEHGVGHRAVTHSQRMGDFALLQ